MWNKMKEPMDRWIFGQNTVDVQMTDKVQVARLSWDMCHKGSTLRRVRGREGQDFDWRLGQTDHATFQEDFPKVSASCGLLLLVVSVALAAVPPSCGLRACSHAVSVVISPCRWSRLVAWQQVTSFWLSHWPHLYRWNCCKPATRAEVRI